MVTNIDGGVVERDLVLLAEVDSVSAVRVGLLAVQSQILPRFRQQNVVRAPDGARRCAPIRTKQNYVCAKSSEEKFPRFLR